MGDIDVKEHKHELVSQDWREPGGIYPNYERMKARTAALGAYYSEAKAAREAMGKPLTRKERRLLAQAHGLSSCIAQRVEAGIHTPMIGPQEAFDEEVAAWVAEVAKWPAR